MAINPNNNSVDVNPVKEKIQLAGIGMFVATLPFYREVNQVFYVLFLLSCIPLFNRTLWQKRKKMIIAFTGIYLVAIFSTLYAPDVKLAFSGLEIQLAILLTPVFLGVSYIPSKEKNKVVKISFIAGVMIGLIALMFAFEYKMFHENISLSAMLQLQNLNHQYSAPIDIHATFFSTYVTVCVSFILQFLAESKKALEKIFLSLLIVIGIVSLFLLLSRIVLVVYGICLLVYIFWYNRFSWFVKIFVGVCVVVTFIFFVRQSSYFKERFNQDLKKDIKLTEVKDLFFKNDLSAKKKILANDGSRIERWVAAVELIKEKPILGFGTGQEKPALFKKYEEMGLTVTLQQKYDAHNQLLSIMIQSGIGGMIALIALFVFAFYISFKYNDPVYISFLLVIAAVCLIDNYFGPNKGIFFFSFFNIFFAISCLDQKQLEKRW